MAEDFKPPVRVNARISNSMNEWLDRKSEEMALTKSSLINLALENYRKETETMHVMPEIIKKMQQEMNKSE